MGICKKLPSQEYLQRHFSYDGKRLLRKNGSRAETPTGSPDSSGHLKVGLDGEWYYAHNLIWKLVTGLDPKYSIRHANGIPWDNTFDNLVDVPDYVELTETCLGVCRDGVGWRIRIVHKGNSVHFGNHHPFSLVQKLLRMIRVLFFHVPVPELQEIVEEYKLYLQNKEKKTQTNK